MSNVSSKGYRVNSFALIVKPVLIWYNFCRILNFLGRRWLVIVKIAFCDDELIILNALCNMLDQYRAAHNQEIYYTMFHSAFDLLAKIENGIRFDVIFLDVLMPGQNGIDSAKEIRNYDSNVKIVFLTSSAEYAVQSYTVGAYFYQLKPICKESFFALMDSAISACKKEKNDSLILRCKDGITRVTLQHLEYCEVIHHTLFIHLADGKVLESIGSLDELCKKLESYGAFLRIHRSYLVNMDYVQSLSYHSITMACLEEISLPRGKYKKIKEAYLEYAFQNRKVIL